MRLTSLSIAVSIFFCFVFFNFKNIQYSLSIRVGYWEAALNILKSHPFGIGSFQFQHFMSEYLSPLGTETRFVHNDFLQHFVEYGWIGGFLFLICLLFFIISIKNSSPISIQFNAKSIFPITFFLAVGILYVLQLSFSIPFYLGNHAWLFWVLSALISLIFSFLKIEKINSKVILGILLAYICQAFFDFPSYDHLLFTLPFLLALFLQPKTSFQSKKLMKYLPLFIFILLAFFGMRNFKHQKLQVWVDTPIQSQEHLKNLRKLCLQNPKYLPIWKAYDKALQKFPFELKERIFTLNHLIDLQPRNTSFLFRRALSRDEPKQKEMDLLKVVQLHPRKSSYSYHLGIHYLEQGMEIERKQYFKQALSLHQQAEARSVQKQEFKTFMLQPKQLTFVKRQLSLTSPASN